MSNVAESVQALVAQAEKNPDLRRVFLEVAEDHIALAWAQVRLAEKVLKGARKIHIREPAPIPEM